ncbi:MAG TPA: hypothetical protein VI603_07330 [Saprospiraceae bacterium]|nr:hypothetical protein [Saprospiraceae bacterium]
MKTEMHPVVHFEMPYEDGERLEKFYKNVFGWQMKNLGSDMGNYVTATTTERDENRMIKTQGAINGVFFPIKADWPALYPSVVIAIRNIGIPSRELMRQEEKSLASRWRFPASDSMIHSLIRRVTG